MNSIAKITIPVEKIYAAINSADVLNAQSIIERNSVADEANSVRNVTEYNSMAAAIKQVNDAIKIVESARKEVTAPVDHFKKELIALERQTVDRLNTFIASAKVKMLDYHNEVELFEAKFNVGVNIYELEENSLNFLRRSLIEENHMNLL